MTNNFNENNSSRIDILVSLIEANARAIGSQQEQINNVSVAVGTLADTVLQLAQKVDRVVETMNNQIMVIAQQQDSIAAEQERQGRILDYLMRQREE